MIARCFGDLPVLPIESYAVGELRLDGYGRRCEQHIFRFDNGYGASVVRGDYTYGGAAGLWELSLIVFVQDRDWHLSSTVAVIDDSPGTLLEVPNDDSIGWLTDERVAELLLRIMALDPSR